MYRQRSAVVYLRASHGRPAGAPRGPIAECQTGRHRWPRNLSDVGISAHAAREPSTGGFLLQACASFCPSDAQGTSIVRPKHNVYFWCGCGCEAGHIGNKTCHLLAETIHLAAHLDYSSSNVSRNDVVYESFWRKICVKNKRRPVSFFLRRRLGNRSARKGSFE